MIQIHVDLSKKSAGITNQITFLNLGFFLSIENCLAKVFFYSIFSHNLRTTSDRAKLRVYLELVALN